MFIHLFKVCIKYACTHHKVCIKCARCRLYRLCRLGAHSTHHGFLGWSVDWGQYMMAFWHELMCKSLLPVPGCLSSSIFFSRKSGLAGARRFADDSE